MTKEEFEKICAIGTRLNDLKNARKYLGTESYTRLVYERYHPLSDDWLRLEDTRLKPLKDILEKHHKMIYQEIDNEIAALEKEIEELD